MNRLGHAVFCPLLLLCTLPLLAQNPAPANDQPEDASPQQIERIPPPSPTASAVDLEEQGDLLRSKKAYLDAIDYYKVAAEKVDSATLHNKVGICLLQLKHYGEAKKEFQHSVKMDSKDSIAHNNLGAVCYQLKEYGVAVKEYKKAISLSQQNASFHSNLGAAYFSLKDFERAQKEYTVALRLDPTIFDHQISGGISARLISTDDLAHYHYLIAKMYGVTGDLDHCRLYLSKANEEGYPFVKDALKENEFASLRKDPGFITFVRSLKPTETN